MNSERTATGKRAGLGVRWVLGLISVLAVPGCSTLGAVGRMAVQGPAAAMEETLEQVDMEAPPEPLPTLPPEEQARPDYDFVPGSRVLASEDFESAAPAMWLGEGGSDGAGVVEENGLRLLKVTEYESRLTVPLGEELPPAFTIELSVYDPEGWEGVTILTSPPSEAATWRLLYSQPYFVVGHRDGSGVRRGRAGGIVSASPQERTKEALWPVRIRVVDSSADVWVGYEHVATVEGLNFPRSDRLYLMVPVASESGPVYIDDIRVAAIH